MYGIQLLIGITREPSLFGGEHEVAPTNITQNKAQACTNIHAHECTHPQFVTLNDFIRLRRQPVRLLRFDQTSSPSGAGLVKISAPTNRRQMVRIIVKTSVAKLTTSSVLDSAPFLVCSAQLLSIWKTRPRPTDRPAGWSILFVQSPKRGERKDGRKNAILESSAAPSIADPASFGPGSQIDLKTRPKVARTVVMLNGSQILPKRIFLVA
ncbi:unnamed protein product [Protopolystoma xenopodis]|uniref:Uncharacterized protein n=1 Tax=Protopolystoma xenopodis TaxID=117903 RepID=A0A448XBX6_9PLAT|nr:unnamed protein product [Protopolystoma xenopodis]